MNWLEFFASVIDSLAWPVAILLLIYLLKDNLISLVPYIQKLKYKDFELELKETKQKFAEVSVEDKDQITSLETLTLYRLAELSPRSAIVESWIDLEKAAAEIIAKRTQEEPGAMTALAPQRLGSYLLKKGLISDRQFNVFNNLRELRNKSVHFNEDTITSEEAVEYVGMASKLADQLRSSDVT